MKNNKVVSKKVLTIYFRNFSTVTSTKYPFLQHKPWQAITTLKVKTFCFIALKYITRIYEHNFFNFFLNFTCIHAGKKHIQKMGPFFRIPLIIIRQNRVKYFSFFSILGDWLNKNLFLKKAQTSLSCLRPEIFWY